MSIAKLLLGTEDTLSLEFENDLNAGPILSPEGTTWEKLGYLSPEVKEARWKEVTGPLPNSIIPNIYSEWTGKVINYFKEKIGLD